MHSNQAHHTQTIQVWHDTGSRWAAVEVELDPTLSEVLEAIDAQAEARAFHESIERGVSPQGYDVYGCYCPDLTHPANDVHHIARRF